MILNINNLDVSQKNTWFVLTGELEKLGYDLHVSPGGRGARVLDKAGVIIGEVTRDMIEDEEINYILNSRLNLKKLDA